MTIEFPSLKSQNTDRSVASAIDYCNSVLEFGEIFLLTVY